MFSQARIFYPLLFKSFTASQRIVSALYYDSSIMRWGHSRVSKMLMDICLYMSASIVSNLRRFGHKQVDLKYVQQFVSTDMINFK